MAIALVGKVKKSDPLNGTYVFRITDGKGRSRGRIGVTGRPPNKPGDPGLQFYRVFRGKKIETHIPGGLDLAMIVEIITEKRRLEEKRQHLPQDKPSWMDWPADAWRNALEAFEAGACEHPLVTSGQELYGGTP